MRQAGVHQKLATDLSKQEEFFMNENQFKEELEILTGSFCSIFQACVKANAKVMSTNQSNEMEWRGDHDRLFFDFFLRPIYPDLKHNDSTRAL